MRKRMVMASAALAIALCTMSGPISATPDPTDQHSPPGEANWRTQLVVSPDADQTAKTLLTIASRPFSDSGVIVPWLEENAPRLDYRFMLELSRRVFDSDKDAALRWYVIALARVAYAGGRCADPSAGGHATAAIAFTSFGQAINRYIEGHLDEYLVAINFARNTPDLFGDGSFPASICNQGMAGFGKRLGIQPSQIHVDFKPESEWPAVQNFVRNQLSMLAAGTEKRIEQSRVVIAPSQVPAAVLSGSLEVKVNAIGDEARTALTLTVDHNQAFRLQQLAEAEINVGDLSGARQTLRVADAISSQATTDYERHFLVSSIPLWIRAGDIAAAKALADGVQVGLLRIEAWRLYGSGFAQTGDLSGVNYALNEIDEAYAQIKDSPEISAAASRIAAQRGGDPRVLAIDAISEALANSQQFHAAIDAAGRMPPSILRAQLFSEIAARQCQAKDPTARSILERAARDENETEPMRPKPPPWLARAYTICGNNPATSANEFQPGNNQVDRDSVSKIDTTTQLLDLAQRDIARNDVAGAKAALAKAYGLVQKQIDDVKRGAVPTSQLPFAASDLSHIISAYIKLGAFDEAVNASEPLAHIDRPFYLWEVIDAEVRKHDDVALKKTLPEIMSKMATEDYKADGNLVGLATILARGGYVDEAHEALRRAQQLAEEGQNGYSVAGLREQIAIALAAMGDVAGARAILQSGTQPGRKAYLVPVVRELADDGRFEQVSQICRELSELEARTCAGALETTVIKRSDGQYSRRNGGRLADHGPGN